MGMLIISSTNHALFLCCGICSFDVCPSLSLPLFRSVSLLRFDPKCFIRCVTLRHFNDAIHSTLPMIYKLLSVVLSCLWCRHVWTCNTFAGGTREKVTERTRARENKNEYENYSVINRLLCFLLTFVCTVWVCGWGLWERLSARARMDQWMSGQSNGRPINQPAN